MCSAEQKKRSNGREKARDSPCRNSRKLDILSVGVMHCDGQPATPKQDENRRNYLNEKNMTSVWWQPEQRECRGKWSLTDHHYLQPLLFSCTSDAFHRSRLSLWAMLVCFSSDDDDGDGEQVHVTERWLKSQWPRQKKAVREKWLSIGNKKSIENKGQWSITVWGRMKE